MDKVGHWMSLDATGVRQLFQGSVFHSTDPFPCNKLRAIPAMTCLPAMQLKIDLLLILTWHSIWHIPSFLFSDVDSVNVPHIDFDVLSGIVSDIFSNIPFAFFWPSIWHVMWHSFGIYSDMVSHNLAGILSDINFDTLSGIFWHSIRHFFDTYSDLAVDMLPNMLSDTLPFFVDEYFDILSHLTSDVHSDILSFIWHFVQDSLRPIHVGSFVAFYIWHYDQTSTVV